MTLHHWSLASNYSTFVHLVNYTWITLSLCKTKRVHMRCRRNHYLFFILSCALANLLCEMKPWVKKAQNNFFSSSSSCACNTWPCNESERINSLGSILESPLFAQKQHRLSFSLWKANITVDDGTKTHQGHLKTVYRAHILCECKRKTFAFEKQRHLITLSSSCQCPSISHCKRTRRWH